MKPDGVTMETPEPTEAAAIAEPSLSQDNATEQTSSQPEETANDAAPAAAPKASGKPVAVDPKVKPKAVTSKTQPKPKSAGVSGSNSRPGAASHRTVNDVKSSHSVSAAAAKKTAATTAAKAAAASAAGAVPKRPLGAAVAVSTSVKNQTRVPEKKPVGPPRTTSVAAATVTNGTKTTTTTSTVNGTPKKKPVAETVNLTRPKTTATASRPAASTAPKPSTSTTASRVAAASRTRPATAPSTARPASTTSRPTTATTKPSITATTKTTASRLTTAPSTGRITTAPPPKTAAAKKDVGRPPSAAVAQKSTTATTSAASKKPEPSKPTATAKLNSATKWSTTAKATDSKVSQSKTQSPAKPPTIKPVALVRFPALNKPPLGRTPPSSPASKPASGSTPQSKRGTKPTQAVPPFTATKKTGASNKTRAALQAAGTVVAAATVSTILTDTQAEAAVTLPQGSFPAASAPEEVPPPVLVQDTPPEVVPQDTVQSHAAAPSPPQSPVRTTLPEASAPQEQLESSAPLLTTQEQIPAPAEPTLPVASLLDLCEESVYLLTHQTPSTSKAFPAPSNAIPQIVPPANLNEEEDEEEREGSQLVSVSEMSGTTQPTEESRPGSAGPVAGSAWRAGGALLSELDSEDVSGSQQGASELSAPGVLEGTESMDDLGDGSLKGAIDMEGASAGSPDFEKVPDIPVNDFDEDDEDDDYDRVCDMDVGSERTDELQRPRHDNDVNDEEQEEEDEDEDVDMASEGVTESGLESYGNADEDDFDEDERLDNLNRVDQLPPPPPLLPSAPAAQWDQPNPFADPWAEPVKPQQVPEHVPSVGGEAAASLLADPWQADSETPTQNPAQAWLELGSAPFVIESQDTPHHSSVKDEPQNLEAQLHLDQSSPALMQTLAPAPLSAPGMSLSSTVSSDTSTTEKLGDYNRDDKLQPRDVQAPQLSPQLDLGIHLDRGEDEGEEEEAEAETLPADEVLGAPVTAPTSNPSSSSVTEDEASDTEGEAQLDDSLESPALGHITFDSQPPAQRCLSTVEEGEELEMAGGDTTPPSATSLASYGFDTMTTASNSNAQSTGESCIKSPGIFSLEELPEEAKEPGLIPQPLTQPCLAAAEQQYIECGKQEAESAELVLEEAAGSEEATDPSSTLPKPEEHPDDIQPPYYSAICEKTENSFAEKKIPPAVVRPLITACEEAEEAALKLDFLNVHLQCMSAFVCILLRLITVMKGNSTLLLYFRDIEV
ncbi:mucin-5AC isoform X2 [Scophthalmus maximus]|uniref:mucin-5AC isoform X2 n=1 Tax=Scophthalmus maximus TaxID=52904 RepID=UPI001FA91BEF|nr:mucin-5AC isoform X2 [Scophthalmus maximus]